MHYIGKLKTYRSEEINNSYVSIGFETLDRELFKPEKCYDLLAQSGVKHARCQTGWARCEQQKGVYDFRWLDEIVDNLLARGVKPWFNVGYGNPLYMPNSPNPTAVGCVPLYYGNEALRAWEKYIAALAEHFKDRITHYEIWNEPDSDPFWYPQTANGAEYAKLVNLTSKIIRNASPTAKIGGCLTHMFNFGFFKDVVAHLEKDSISFYCYHAYMTVPEFRYTGLFNALRRFLDEGGFAHVELWQGETGYPSWVHEGHHLFQVDRCNERAQAVFQIRRYFIDLSHGAKMCSFFQMADMWEKTYETATVIRKKAAAHGVLNGLTYTPKKAYETITRLATIFSGNIAPKPSYMHVDLNPGTAISLISTQTMSFEKDGKTLYAYYLPIDIGTEFSEDYTAGLLVEETLEEPILIDPYTGEVFALEKGKPLHGLSNFEDLPIKDYPLILTERSVFAIEEA